MWRGGRLFDIFYNGKLYELIREITFFRYTRIRIVVEKLIRKMYRLLCGNVNTVAIQVVFSFSSVLKAESFIY